MSADTGAGSALSIDVKEYADCRVVSVSGRVDHSNSTGFMDALQAHAGEMNAGGGMVIDLSGLEFVTSAGLRALLVAHRTVSGAGGQMIVTGLTGVVKEVFRISKFDSLLNVADGLGEAVGQISTAAADAFPG